MGAEMQQVMQVVSPMSTGDPAAQEVGGTNTARGMMIMNSKSQGLQGPKLMMAAEGKANALKQCIQLARENIVDEVPIPLKAQTGEPEWAILSGENLDEDLHFYARPDSWLPHPREEKQAALANVLGGPMGQVFLNPQIPPEIRDAINEAYNLQLDFADYDLDKRDAMLRLDKMTELLPQAMNTAQQLMQPDGPFWNARQQQQPDQPQQPPP